MPFHSKLFFDCSLTNFCISLSVYVVDIEGPSVEIQNYVHCWSMSFWFL